MDIFSGFKKNFSVLVRCTHCYYEYELSSKEVKTLESLNAEDPFCPLKEECHICHIGFMIPVKYTDKSGKQYLYHDIKLKIKNLDPNTVMERIFDSHDAQLTCFFWPESKH